jgi:hypothetical protein
MNNTEIDESFVDSPPQGYLNWSQKTLALIQLAAKNAKVDLENIALLVGSYKLVSAGLIKVSEDEIMEQIALMDDDEFDSVVSYIARVNDRANAASVETESGGK